MATQQATLTATTEAAEGQSMTAAEISGAVEAFNSGQPSVLPDIIAETERQQLAGMAVEVRRFEHNQRLARCFVASGLFKGVKGQTAQESVAKAMVLIELGSSMGFSPIESMQGIHVIQGVPSIGAHLRAARMQAANYSWRFVETSEKRCHMKVFFGGEELGEIGYTIEEAQKAKLHTKDNWVNNPSDMLFSRAITRAQRRFAPAALKGQTILDMDEASEIVNDDPIVKKSEEKVEGLRAKLEAAKGQAA